MVFCSTNSEDRETPLARVSQQANQEAWRSSTANETEVLVVRDFPVRGSLSKMIPTLVIMALTTRTPMVQLLIVQGMIRLHPHRQDLLVEQV